MGIVSNERAAEGATVFNMGVRYTLLKSHLTQKAVLTLPLPRTSGSSHTLHLQLQSLLPKHVRVTSSVQATSDLWSLHKTIYMYVASGNYSSNVQ